MKRVLVIAPLLAGCFQPWQASGLYRCGGGCPTDMTCDDGVCCRENGEPACPTLVPTSGRCAGGSLPKTFYADQDQDTFGNPAVSRAACSRPLMEVWVENMNDCDDGSPAAYPGGNEVCDGRDNDCDGVPDDGQTPLVAYFRDTDGDGYGVMTDTLMACQCASPCVPPGYSATAGDCAPADNMRHPTAAERCNGLDDDCNGQMDDAVSVGVGATCGDGGIGECAQATTACVSGAIVCQPRLPSRDLCDGRDNNCNGATDEAPDCGGPSSFFDAGVLIGARNTGVSTGLNPPATCLRSMGVGEGWTGLMWSGSGDNFHVWYAEAPGTTTWDLSKTGWQLHLQLNTTMLNFNATNPWNTFNQPFVLVCSQGAAQFSRYRPQNATLLTAANVMVNTDLPLAGGNGWLLAQGGADLTQVKRIEVVVQPTNNAPMNPSFNITFNSSSGFKQ